MKPDIGAESPENQEKATDRLRSHTATVREDLREFGRLTKDVASEKLDEARGAATDYYEQGHRKVGNLEGQVLQYVREKPLKSLLIATGAGLVLGALLSRK